MDWDTYSNPTSWGSKNAEDMFRIAVVIAGFDASELMLEIHKRSTKGRRVKVSTVLAAMQTIVLEKQGDKNEKLDCLPRGAPLRTGAMVGATLYPRRG